VQSSDVLDKAVIAELRRAQEQFGNPGFISQLVGLFRENAPQRMDQIRAAVAAGDGAALERVAHTLKTNCALLGASGMADLCARLEDAGARADFGAAARALAEAEVLFPAVLEAVVELAPSP
jgi:HPt (histidine-containing phosphotransfer) domain-containing protein